MTSNSDLLRMCCVLVQVLVGVHQLYTNYVQSPFAPLSGKVNSDRFRHGVTRQANLYNGVG